MPSIDVIVQQLSIIALPLIFAITLHEVAHGIVAYWCGDYTAKLSGRLSLNPMKHIDPLGTIVLPIFMLVVSNFQFLFGWAKPVPVDPRNLRHPRRDMALVAIAGPISNLLMAVVWGLIGRGGYALMDTDNLWFGKPMAAMGQYGITINVLLAVLNLLPIPPLDGGRVFASILPPRWSYHFSKIEPFGFAIIIVLLLTGVLSKILIPIISVIQFGIAKLVGF